MRAGLANIAGTASVVPAVFDSVLSSDALAALIQPPASAAPGQPATPTAGAGAGAPATAASTLAPGEPAPKRKPGAAAAAATAAVGSVWHLATAQALAKRPDRPAFAGRPAT